MLPIGRSCLIGISDIIEGVVTVADTYGAYAVNSDVDYFIPLHELSWDRLTAATDVVAVGDPITFVVLRASTASSGPLGSWRRAHLHLNPWRDPSVFAVGTSFRGVVAKLTSYGAFIQHPRKSLALLRDTSGSLHVGKEVDVVITESDADSQKLLVTLL